MSHGPTYIVYSYQYHTMPKPQYGAFRRTFHDRRDLDSMPPTVIKWVNVAATTQREALQVGKPLVGKG